jgi:hypothetical protein
MSDKIQSTSLLDGIDLPETGSPAPKVSTPQEAAPKAPSRKRKEKPYNQLKTVTAHADNKKAAKKIVKAGKKEPVIKKAPAKKIVKASPKKVSKPEPSSSSGAKAANCSFCGKPLSRHSSVVNGMGDVCAKKRTLLGGKSLAEHRESMIVTELPEGFIHLREAARIANKKGVTTYQFLIAIGGNGAVRPPLNADFKIVFFKNTRYISKKAVTDKSLALLKK